MRGKELKGINLNRKEKIRKQKEKKLLDKQLKLKKMSLFFIYLYIIYPIEEFKNKMYRVNLRRLVHYPTLYRIVNNYFTVFSFGQIFDMFGHGEVHFISRFHYRISRPKDVENKFSILNISISST